MSERKFKDGDKIMKTVTRKGGKWFGTSGNYWGIDAEAERVTADGRYTLVESPAPMPEVFVDGMVLKLGELTLTRNCRQYSQWPWRDPAGKLTLSDDEIRAIDIAPTMPEQEPKPTITDEELGRMVREVVDPENDQDWCNALFEVLTKAKEAKP